MDFQCVLLCPQTKASTIYYKTKLQMHNFTCFNLSNKDGYCYAWEEHKGSLSSEVFAHLQSKHFESILEANGNIEKVIAWSDGCGYQNRCGTISNTYLHLAMKHGVAIDQKFVVAGHTQMECESTHRFIERCIIKDSLSTWLHCHLWDCTNASIPIQGDSAIPQWLHEVIWGLCHQYSTR